MGSDLSQRIGRLNLVFLFCYEALRLTCPTEQCMTVRTVERAKDALHDSVRQGVPLETGVFPPFYLRRSRQVIER